MNPQQDYILLKESKASKHIDEVEQKEMIQDLKTTTGLIKLLSAQFQLGLITKEQYHERLKDYYSFLSGLSGLIAGFTYVVASQDPGFNNAGNKQWRMRVYGILSVSAFLLAMSSTLMSIIMWTTLNFIGVQNVELFVLKFASFVSKPNLLNVIGIFCMLGSIAAAIGGWYDNFVVIYSFVFGGIMICTFLLFYLWASAATRNILKEQYKLK
eukprot:462165_1